jgi:putative ABC transport system permease protein
VMVCANLANLLLARASTRDREFAVRIALGAARTRILRQLLTEGILLALFGACAGVLFASWGLYALQGESSAQTVGLGDLPHVGQIAIDGRALVFTLAIACLAGILFGIAPMRDVMRNSVQTPLKAGSSRSSSRRIGLRDVLVSAETALGVIVIIGAVLLLHSFLLLQRAPLGFDPNRLLTFRVIPRGALYSQPQRLTEFYEQALMKIQSLPGVKNAGAISFLPLSFYRETRGYLIDGIPALAAQELPTAVYDVVSPGYFDAMGVPVREGRSFSWADMQGTLPVVMVNQAMARKYWPGRNIIGQRIKEGGMSAAGPWLTIVGVVGDYREFDVASPPLPTVFLPVSQTANHGGLLRDWVVRTSASPLALASAVRDAIWSNDKNLPVSRLRTMEQVRSGSTAQQQFILMLLSLSALLALVLAAVGLYGVTAYATAQRSREIGIRMALGAQKADVFRLVLREGLLRAGAGVVLGIAGALALTRFLDTLLFEIRPNDPLTFAGVAVLLALVALLACYLPARRAMKVDPIVALRCE